MDNEIDFVETMRAVNPYIVDFDDALFYAMQNVRQFEDRNGVRFFGTLGGGVFYSDSESYENTRWYPDTSYQEGLTNLWLEFGEQFTEGISDEQW